MRGIKWAFMDCPPLAMFEATCDNADEAKALHDEAKLYAELNRKLEDERGV